MPKPCPDHQLGLAESTHAEAKCWRCIGCAVGSFLGPVVLLRHAELPITLCVVVSFLNHCHNIIEPEYVRRTENDCARSRTNSNVESAPHCVLCDQGGARHSSAINCDTDCILLSRHGGGAALRQRSVIDRQQQRNPPAMFRVLAAICIPACRASKWDMTRQARIEEAYHNHAVIIVLKVARRTVRECFAVCVVLRR